MDSKKQLLNAFYSTIDKSQFKIETKEYLPELLDSRKTDAVFQYGEFKNGIFKYRFSNSDAKFFDQCLEDHLSARSNLCCYLDPNANNLFVFNLDTFEKLGEVDRCAELKAFATALSDILFRLGLRPLILRSGHGYHFWCRLAAPVENHRLRALMDAVVEVAVLRLTAARIDLGKLQCICYPRVNTNDVSIRLFGSRHAVTGRFCGVVEKIGENRAILGDAESWLCFEQFMNRTSLDSSQFARALGCAKELRTLIK